MKKQQLVFAMIASFLAVLIFAAPVFSQQDLNKFDQAYKDYTLAIEKYRQVHDEYILTRSQYIKFQTLTSQNNAKQAAVAMLQARDDVVIKYINSIKAKIEDTSGTPTATKEGLFLRLDEELNWFNNHKNNLSSAGSLADLVEDSDEARDRFEDDDPLIYESLSNISAGKVNKFRDRLNEIFSKIRDKVNNIKEEERSEYQFSTRKLETIDRWVFETESRVARSEEKQQEGDESISGFGEDRNSSSRYNKTLNILGESHQFLKEASLFMKEIVREIKTAE